MPDLDEFGRDGFGTSGPRGLQAGHVLVQMSLANCNSALVLIGFSLVHPQPSPSAMARRQSSGIAAGWLDGEAQRNLAPAPVHMSAEHVAGFFTTCRVVVLGLLGRLLFKSIRKHKFKTKIYHVQ